MSQSLVQIYVHIVFSTEHRQPFLMAEEHQREMFRILGGICNDLGCPVLRVAGAADHVHILCRLGRQIDIADAIKELKRQSSIAIKTNEPNLHDFHWQKGYGAFSVSPGHIKGLLEYIANQAEHHRKETYMDEFRRLLRLYGLEWDERFLWE